MAGLVRLVIFILIKQIIMKAFPIIYYFCIQFLVLGCALQLHQNGYYPKWGFYFVCAIMGLFSGWMGNFINKVAK